MNIYIYMRHESLLQDIYQRVAQVRCIRARRGGSSALDIEGSDIELEVGYCTVHELDVFRIQESRVPLDNMINL